MDELTRELNALMHVLHKNHADEFDGSLGSIYRIVFNEFNVKDNPNTRDSMITVPRQTAHAIALSLRRGKMHPYTVKAIGEAMGNRNYATVLHSARVIGQYLNTGMYNDVITICASKFGLTLEDLILTGEVKPQVYIEAHKDGCRIERFFNREMVVRYFGVTKQDIAHILNTGGKVKGYKLIIKRDDEH